MARFEYIVKHVKRPNPRSRRRRVLLRIDGEALNLGYCLDETALKQSFEAPGNYWILTCDCGEPGCAGLYTPFEVEHLNGDIIHWHVTDPGPERDFYFSRGQALRELEKAKLVSRPIPDLPMPISDAETSEEPPDA